jgi:regulator of protease activity HflC (stomatin/prohibitin superfamily)
MDAFMIWIIIAAAIVILALSIRIVRQTHRGLVERFGKYNRFAEPGLHFLIPFVEHIHRVDITESMMEIDTQEIITEDNLNAKVDLVVYFKVVEDEKAVKNSVYKVTDFEPQITRLAQTTARNVIGNMKFKDVNSKRNQLNKDLGIILKKETASWGVEILRVELKEITPPAAVQETMNSVIQAENTKRAAIDFATAKETEADGVKRAEIKKAEGVAQAKKIIASGQAEAIRLVNESAQKHFKGNAQILKKLEVTEASLKDNAKIIVTDKGVNPQLIIGELPVK